MLLKQEIMDHLHNLCDLDPGIYINPMNLKWCKTSSISHTKVKAGSLSSCLKVGTACQEQPVNLSGLQKLGLEWINNVPVAIINLAYD